MPTIFFRIFLLYNLVLDYLVPKKLKSVLYNLLLDYLVPKKLKSVLFRSHIDPIHTTTTFVSTASETETHTSSEPILASASPCCGLKKMDQAELKEIFQMFDKNGDGAITKKELNDLLENMGIFISDSELTQMIERIDVNGDMCIDIDEFSELYQSITDNKDEEEDMKEAFNVFDQNGDGYISVDELRSVLNALGLKQGKAIEDCKRMITKVDVDGDGRVNFMEFKQMMKGGGLSAMT